MRSARRASGSSRSCSSKRWCWRRSPPLVGLTAAHYALKWGLTAYYAGAGTGVPFWVSPGLKMSTVIFAAGLTVIAAAILGVLPALKATGKDVQTQLRSVGSGGSTLRFGAVWTTVMIAQVALTVICLPPAMGVSEEAWRDRVIRSRFPAEQYLAVRLDVDRDVVGDGGRRTRAAFAERFTHTYSELERRIAEEPSSSAITYGDRLPGMGIAVRSAEVEASPGAPPVPVGTAWTAAVGPKYFETFDVPAGGRPRLPRRRSRGFGAHRAGQREFARVHLEGVNPVGKRLRFTSAGPSEANATTPGTEPWLEIVGMVRDIGMQPTDRGEAPFIFRAATLATARPVVMGIRITGDPAALAQRVRTIALEVDPALRLGDVRSLEDLAWEQEFQRQSLRARSSAS